MSQLTGCIIAESLQDPTLINHLTTYRAHISADERPIDHCGGRARWHLYWVCCEPPDVATVQRQLKPGWYAHFWDGADVTVVYADARFEMRADNRTTWAAAVAHGRRHGIPDDELDFLTD